MQNNEFDIYIIQGDDYNIVYQFTDKNGKILDNTSISNVYMTCSQLGYQTTLTWNEVNKGFALSIPSSITTNFPQIVTSYDLTVHFMNAYIQTEIYEAKIQILLKRNKVNIDNG